MSDRGAKRVKTFCGTLSLPESDTRDLILDAILSLGEWGRIETQLAGSLVRSGDRLWDAGAFVGTFGLGIAAECDIMSLVALEGNPGLREHLEDNLASNLSVPFSIEIGVLAPDSGRYQVSVVEKENIGCRRFIRADRSAVEAVEGKTLSTLRVVYGDYDFLKLDIEGMEAEVLVADADYILDARPVLWAECNERNESVALFRVLMELGYSPRYVAYPCFASPPFLRGSTPPFPLAYEASLVGAPPDRLAAFTNPESDSVIMRDVASEAELREAMWNTPRWTKSEWGHLKRPELLARLGRAERGELRSSFLVAGNESGVEATVRSTELDRADALDGQVPLPNCPSCGAAASLDWGAKGACMNCGHNAPNLNGIVDLRRDPAADTTLDLGSYDTTHGVSDSPSRSLFDAYASVVASHGQDMSGALLEIGAGTGNLTLGLAAFSRLRSITASDISPRFLCVLNERAEARGLAARLKLCLVDAHSIPFDDSSFDLVLGNSILHHVLHFENTLRECQRILRPGGLAVFGEPMMELNSLSFLAAGFLAAASADSHARLSPEVVRRLGHIAKIGQRKANNFISRDAKVAGYEDKFIFEASQLRRIAREIGFRGYELHQHAPLDDLASAIFTRLTEYFRNDEIALSELEGVRHLLLPFTDAYQASFVEAPGRAFAFNAFIR